MNLKRLMLISDCNNIFDPKLDIRLGIVLCFRSLKSDGSLEMGDIDVTE